MLKVAPPPGVLATASRPPCARTIDWPANGRLLASGGADGSVRLWETGTARLLATLQGHTRGVWGVALSADSQLLASGGEDGTVWLWDTGTGRPLAALQGHSGDDGPVTHQGKQVLTL